MLEEKDTPGVGHDIEQGTYERRKVSYVARRVVVQVAPMDDETALDATLDATLEAIEGARRLRPVSRTGRMVVLLPEGESVPAACRKLGALEGVAYAEPDFVDQLQVVPNDPRYPLQWGPAKVNAEAAWDLEKGDSNVLIGIIDSGISMTGGVLDHEDLSTPGRFTLGTDFIDGGVPRDTGGHGTHVAGIAAAVGDNAAGIAGMNWYSPVYICRTFGPGGGSHADFADAVEEITDYAVANGLKAAINYSGGGSDSLTKKNACQYASDNGMLLVAATGNDNGGPVIFPAAYSTSITGVVAVGSTDSDDTVSSFSNVGPEVTVVAPGRNIQSTLPTYATPGNPTNYGSKSGTSMATPLVTGLAALMWSRFPGHSNAKVKQCLGDTAVELGAGNFDNSWGHGRVDALAALKCGAILGPAPSKLTFCGPSVITLCHVPSKLPVLCPVKSQLVVCEAPSLLTCPSRLACPSVVDGCPSTPGGCEWEIDPRIVTQPVTRWLRTAVEEWYRVIKEPGVGDEGWFYLDDDGKVHRT